MNFKELYTFTINKMETTETVEVSKNEKGEEIKIVKPVKTEKPVSFCLKKPNRQLFDEAELFYGVKLAEAIKAGMLTRTLMIKKYDGDGGIFTQNEVNRIRDVLVALGDLQKEALELEAKKEQKTQEDENKLIVLNERIDTLRLELVDIENNKNNLFEQTAENRAKNKTMMWWVLHLSYRKEEGGTYTPLFGEGSYESKIRAYDQMEEEGDEFLKKVMNKFAYFVSFWYSGRASKQEDFKIIEDYLNVEDKPTETDGNSVDKS